MNFVNFLYNVIYACFLYFIFCVVFVISREIYYECRVHKFKRVREYVKNSFLLSKDSIKFAWSGREYLHYVKPIIKKFHEYDIHIHVLVNKISNMIRSLHEFGIVHYLTIIKLLHSLIEFGNKALNVKEYIKNM